MPDETERPSPFGKPIPPEQSADGDSAGWSAERLVDATGDPEDAPEAPDEPARVRVVGVVSELGSVTEPGANTPTARVAAAVGEVSIVVDPRVLSRYRARILDPATAVRTGYAPPPRSTVYVGDRLLVGSARAREQLAEAARATGVRLVSDARREERRTRLIAIAGRAGLPDPAVLFPELIGLEPLAGTAVEVDAWRVLQTFRARLGATSELRDHVTLDHLLTATMHVSPGPFDVAPGTGAPAAASFGQPGWGGRQPVNWLGAAPPRRSEVTGRRPVVAVLDTGTGRHHWFDAPGSACVERNAEVLGVPIGLAEPGGTESTGVVTDPLEGVLDPYSGHGTFIAGLIRQQCPDADLLSVRIMPSAGAVAEHTLLDALSLLLCRQALAQAANDPAAIVDVVNLSLGYYHESADDEVVDSFLRPVLTGLGRRGVAVVVSAGNDATTRPMFPAAFTVYPLGGAADPGAVPLTSVGALNPNGSVALFSNDGPWVTCAEPGADLVSTFPQFDAAQQAAVRFDYGGTVRETLDEDDFTAGFGVWSGTSFAAPVLAGKVAAQLVDDGCGPTQDPDPAVSVSRTSAALDAALTP